MPIDSVSLEIMAIRKGERPNDLLDDQPCPERGCECRFFSRLDLLLHGKRGRHGRMNFETTFRRVTSGYRGAERGKEALYRQGSL